MKYPRRLIEVDLPIKRISEHARKEKNIRHGHISNLHIWWARRPLAACRAVICAALWPDPADELCPKSFREDAFKIMSLFSQMVLTNRTLREGLISKNALEKFMAIQQLKADFDLQNPNTRLSLREILLDFIGDFANYEASNNSFFLSAAHALTKSAHEALGGEKGTRPLVVDPFAGGGAIPIEAIRCGADAFSSDLNPIAAQLNKIIIEYVPKYGMVLHSEVDKWGHWVKDNAQTRLKEFYPEDSSGATVVGYIWARTITCEGPGCGAKVPIIKNAVLSNRRNGEAAISFNYDNDNQLQPRVVLGKEARQVSGGTLTRASVTCPKCSYSIRRNRIEAQSKDQGFGFCLLAVVNRDSEGKRSYRQPSESDYASLKKAETSLRKWEGRTFGGLHAIPQEELPYLRSIFNVRVYGIDKWSKLYTSRQLLSALIFTQLVREAAEKIMLEVSDKQLAQAIIECVALTVSNSFQYQCSIATYLTEGIKSAFIQGQSLPMKMDFIEANPVMDDLAGSYDYSLYQHLSGLESIIGIPYAHGTSVQMSALDMNLPENSIDLLATDPPYYDAVPYADCSDFFYIWLRRMLHGLTTFPTSMELTPKDDEIVQLAERNERYGLRTKSWFENKLRDAMSKAQVAVKTDGIAVIVFAHKQTSAWEALIKSILDAGWVITGSWPIDTENASRLRAKGSAVLASSVHLACRPREHFKESIDVNDVGDWRDVLNELPKRIHDWMPRLAQEGVVGADAIFACLGPALEIFSRYSAVEKTSGEKVTLQEYLEQVWAAVAREALNMIFQGADASGFEEDARLTAMWLWTLRTPDANGHTAGYDENESEEDEGNTKPIVNGYSLEYDAARKIAQGLGAHLESLGHLIEVKGETAILLAAGARTRYLFGNDQRAPSPRRRKPEHQLTFDFVRELENVEEEAGIVHGNLSVSPGSTVLDQLHQSMILFGAGRGEALKRFLVDEGVGRNQHFWRLAQALSALYLSSSEEKRWVDGVMARKKGLGL